MLCDASRTALDIDGFSYWSCLSPSRCVLGAILRQQLVDQRLADPEICPTQFIKSLAEVQHSLTRRSEQNAQSTGVRNPRREATILPADSSIKSSLLLSPRATDIAAISPASNSSSPI
jgi:hypothetical protein